MQSVNNEMSKGAQTIAPVDNSKDELYAILRKRLFQNADVTNEDIAKVADAYVAELKKAKAIIERPTMKVREEILVSWPFHFSTKHLIASFNDNPGFQKTRDVIRLMTAIVRSLWSKGEDEVARHYLLSLETADLNDANVASRFIEIKKSLQDAMQTDIANNGTSHAESLDVETDGLASRCAKWIFAASLSEVHPRGLITAEPAEYMAAPGHSINGITDALKLLYDTCWYIEQTKSGRYFFHRHKNLNAQVNSYTNVCTHQDRDEKIETKLREMFEPRDKRCYQKLEVMSALDQVQLERDRTTLIILKPDADFRKFFEGQKYKNRVTFLTAIDLSGLFTVNKKAERLPPPLDAKTAVFDWVRQDLRLADTDMQASVAGQDKLDDARKFDLEFLPLREVNPFTQWVIKRSRERLEEEGKLVKIEMVPHGDGQPILCSHSMEQAFELAEAFARALHHRVKAGGFIKTLLQRRIGSSLIAGLKTTEKMLAGRPPGDEEDPEEEGASIYPLEESEKALLRRLRDHLQTHLEREDDPKFERVRQVLDLTFEGQKWIDRGVLIFSQFYDSAYALAEYLLGHFDEPIGLYANTSASKLFENGKVQSVDRELLKEKVTQGRLKLLIGTDAASTGLNLQRLGCLINLDLPWNPTILEQRKGRVQRGALAKRIPFYNMRYPIFVTPS